MTGMTDTQGNDPNAMRRPGSLSFAGSQASLNLGSFAYDGAGNLKSIGTDLFAYDRVSRLTEADLQGQAASQSYGFDSFGNLTSITTTKTDATGQPAVTPRTLGVSAATNRLTGSPYDAAGNVTSLFTLTELTYDPFNRVTHLAGTGVNKSFLYTADDLRVGVIDHPFPFGEMAAAGPGVDGAENLFRYTGHERDANCEGCDPEGLDGREEPTPKGCRGHPLS
jgi:hypothetical protein